MNRHPSMKKVFAQKMGRLLLPAIFSLGFFSPSVLLGQTNAYWDVNGTTNGQGGNGTWSASTSFWTTNSVNADANSGGPNGGGLFAVANGAGGSVITNSGNFIFNFGGTAGTITQGGAFQAYGLNFLVPNYIWMIDGTGTNGRTMTTSNGVSLGANSLTLLNGPRGLNSFTFAGPTTASAVGLTGSVGASLTLRNLVQDSTTNSFGVYLSGGSIASTIPINIDIGTGSKISLGSQSSGGATINSAITLNTNASGVALNITNSSSGTVTFNGVISGLNGLVLDNTSSGKITFNGINTYSGGTIVNGTGTGQINLGNSAALGTGTISISGTSTSYLRGAANALDVTNNINIASGATLQLAATNSGWKSTWSGVISGAGGINYSYSDSGLYLTGVNNSFGGGVNVGSTGVLYVNKLGVAGGNSSIGANGTITISTTSANASTIRWTGTDNEVSDKTIVLTSTAGLVLYANGATNSSLTIGGNITTSGSGARTLAFAGYNTNTLILNGEINENGGANSVVIGSTSSGIVVLGNTNNSFTGSVTITNATAGQYTWLETSAIGNSGSVSPLGKNGTINIGSSSSSAYTTIRYKGAGETSDKVINLAGTTGGAILDQSGTGSLKFTSAMTATGVGAKTITLSGSTAGTGELAGNLSDLGGNIISVTKSGTGMWTLSGNNSYTGPTIVGSAGASANGVLRIAGPSALSPNTSFSGSTSVTNISTVDLATAGSYVGNSYGTYANLGNNLNFTASSGGSTTLTFTNATNIMTSGTAQGRYLYNNSSNLLLELQGALDITSSSSNDITIGGSGNINIRGSIINTNTSGVRSITKVGSGALRLFGTNTYNGTNKVSGGSLVMGDSKSLPANTPTVLDGGTLIVGYTSGVSDVLGNLSLTASSSIDLGTGTSGSSIKFASGTNWSNKILTVANSSTGAKLYITNTANVATNQIKSAEDTNAVASLAADGLLTFSAGVVAPSGLSYTPSSITGTVGTAISSLSPSVTGTPTSYSVSPALPDGLSLSTSTGVISGTPTVVAALATYTVTASNSGGSTTATVTIAVNAVAPSGLSYTPSSVTGTVGTAISSLTPSVTGTPTSYSVSPALPAGLSLNTSSGVISGTPSAVTASATYTVTASNSGGSTTATVTIVVNAAGTSFDSAYPGKNLSDLAPNGLTYLVNYAFGGSDTTVPRLPAQDTSDPTKLTLVAYVRTGDATLSVGGQAAASLDFGSPSTAPYVLITPSDAPAGMEKRSYSVGVSGDRQFLRLIVTKQ